MRQHSQVLFNFVTVRRSRGLWGPRKRYLPIKKILRISDRLRCYNMYDLMFFAQNWRISVSSLVKQ